MTVRFGQTFCCLVAEAGGLLATTAQSALGQLLEGLEDDLVQKPRFTHLKTSSEKRKITWLLIP